MRARPAACPALPAEPRRGMPHRRRAAGMLRRHTRILLFLTSYCPLLGIVMIDYLGNAYVVAALAAVMALSVAFILRVFAELGRASGTYGAVEGKVENTSKYIVQYFMAYLIPFFAVGDGGWEAAAKYVVALGIMAFLYIRSDVIYINPTMAMLGYNIYKVSSPESDAVVITRGRIRDRVEGPLVLAVEGVYYERR